jgi:thiol-disulfide isomerase/thioredoxin
VVLRMTLKLGGGRFCTALVTVLLALLLTGCFSVADSPKLFLINGTAVDVSAKPLLFINYWAPWCKPCHEEIPELNAFTQSHQVVMLGVNFDVFTGVHSVSELQTQAAQLNIEFGVLDTPSSRALESHWQLPRPKGLPTTYIISAQGQWVATLLGPQTQQTLSVALTQAKQLMRSAE